MPEPSVTLITGTDTAQISAEAAKVIREVAGENPDPFAFDVVRQGDDQSVLDALNQVVMSINSPAFLGGRKTIWLQHFEGFAGEGAKTAKTPDALAFGRLSDAVAKGLPGDIVLVMDGPGVDKRKRLYKACQDQGRVLVFDKPDVKDRNWQAAMKEVIARVAEAKQVRLTPDVMEFLIQAFGTDTGCVDNELEKLIMYCGGPDGPITLAAAQDVCSGEGEAISWSLTDAVGDRDVAESLRLVDVLLRQEKDAESAAHGLILQISRRYRDLLRIRVFMQEKRVRSPRELRGTTEKLPSEEKERWVEDGFDFVQAHWFRAFKLAEQAVRYTGPELIRAVVHCRDANLQCVSTGASSRVLLEQLVMRMAPAGRQAGRATRGQRRGY